MQELCLQCPRQCGTDRTQHLGFCGAPHSILIARAAIHPWEEPCIATGNGSGTVFFCGCNLRCVFCQNHSISHGKERGTAVTPAQLEQILLALQAAGACNINLVTPTHYVHELVPILQSVRPQLKIPVVYNCGGYESVEALRHLEGLVDIYLPDFKYFDATLSARYSAAPDYFSVAVDALREMLRQCPQPIMDSAGGLLHGVMLRHLILPGCRKDSIALLQYLHREFGSHAFLLSLMSQYTPEFAIPDADANLHRRLTEFEIGSVQRAAADLGFEGYVQDRTSATAGYTPPFGAEQVIDFLNKIQHSEQHQSK